MSLWPRFLAHTVRHRWFQRVSISFSLAQWFSNTYFIRTHISFTISSTCDINTTIFAIFNHFIIINGVSVAMATRLFTFPVCNNVEMGELQKKPSVTFFLYARTTKNSDDWFLSAYQSLPKNILERDYKYCNILHIQLFITLLHAKNKVAFELSCLQSPLHWLQLSHTIQYKLAVNTDV